MRLDRAEKTLTGGYQRSVQLAGEDVCIIDDKTTVYCLRTGCFVLPSVSVGATTNSGVHFCRSFSQMLDSTKT